MFIVIHIKIISCVIAPDFEPLGQIDESLSSLDALNDKDKWYK